MYVECVRACTRMYVVCVCACVYADVCRIILSRADEEEESGSLYMRGNYGANNRVHLQPSFDSELPPVHPEG
jgi:hypothetical protein